MPHPPADTHDRKRSAEDSATGSSSRRSEHLDSSVSTLQNKPDNTTEGDARKRQKVQAAPSTIKPTIGPTLPPELRKQEDKTNDLTNEKRDESSVGTKGPLLPEEGYDARPTSERKPVYGPTLPTAEASASSGEELPQQQEVISKSAQSERKPVYGPSIPPGFGDDDSAGPTRNTTSQRETSRPAVAGPTLPPGYNQNHSDGGEDEDENEEDRPKWGLIYPSQMKKPVHPPAPTTETIAKSDPNARDEWMLLPPENMDFNARAVDPTKLRSRGFNTGRAAHASSAIAEQGGVTSSQWTETPEEKMQRLEAELMGTTVPSKPGQGSTEKMSQRDREKEEKRRRRKEKEEIRAYEERSRQIEEYNIANDRTKSLYAQHQESRREGGHSKPHSSRTGYGREHNDDRDRENGRERERGHRHSRSRRSRDRYRDRSEDRHRETDRERRKDRHRHRHRHGEREGERERHRDRSSRDNRDNKDKDRGELTGYKGKDEDDPSTRPFDKEKDIKSGMTISNLQRRQLVSRASGFSSRFASGGFL